MSDSINEEAKMARRDYYRRWRAANKDKVRESNRRYWQRQGQIRLRKKKEEQNGRN